MRELRVKEIVFRNVHFVSGSQKNVVDGSQASVIEPNPDALANRSSGNNRRSEEHTSELQSHLNLVCRLLLEKKKYNSRPSALYHSHSGPTRHCRRLVRPA